MSAAKISACPVLLTKLPGLAQSQQAAGLADKLRTARQYWWVLPIVGMILIVCFGGSMLPRRHWSDPQDLENSTEPERDVACVPAPLDPRCSSCSCAPTVVVPLVPVAVQETTPPQQVDAPVQQVTHLERLELPPMVGCADENTPKSQGSGALPARMNDPVSLPHGFAEDLPDPTTKHESHSPDRNALHELATFQGHGNTVSCAAFVPGKRWILSGSHDQSLRLWDPISGKEIKRFGWHPSEVSCLAISRDGKRVVTGSGRYDSQHNPAAPVDCVVRIWDLNNGKEVQHLIGHAGPVTAVAFSPDGSCILSASHDRTVRLWEISTGRTLHILSGHTHAVQSVAFGVDGTTAYSAGGTDGSIRTWNLRTGQQMQCLRQDLEPIKCVVALPDGKHIVSAGGDVNHGDRANVPAHGCTIRIWDLDSGRIVASLDGHTMPVTSMACSPDGTHLLSGDLGGSLCLWNLATLGKTSEPRGSGQSDSLVSDSPEMSQSGAQSGWIWATAFSPDAHFALSAGADRTLKLWKLP